MLRTRVVFVLLSAAVSACTEGQVPGPGNGDAGPDAGADAGVPSVAGLITDTFGAPIAGATVSAGQITATSGSDGSYTLTPVPVQSALVILATAAGHIDSAKTVTTTAGKTTTSDIALAASTAPQPLDASAGGTINGPRGATLTAGANAFVDQSGKAITGTVQVSLTPLTPGYPGETGAYPGQMMGTDMSGSSVAMQTHGMMDITVTQSGQKLQIASGQTLSVSIPAPPTGTLPSSSGLWSFDETTALWKEEGTATLMGKVYAATLPHLSAWNVDCASITGVVCLEGQLLDCSGNPIDNAQITVTANDNSWSTQATGSGNFCVGVPPGQGGPGDMTPDAFGKCGAHDSADSWTIEVKAQGLDVSVVVPAPANGAGDTPSCYDQEMAGTCVLLGNLGCASTLDGGSDLFDAGACLYTPGPDAGADGGSDGGSDAGVDSGVTDPFAGTCAQALESFFSCSNPGGGCTITSTLGTSGPVTLTYGNGTTATITTLGKQADISYTTADGGSCGTMETIPGGGANIFPQSLSSPPYTVTSTLIVCPDGGLVVLNPQQSNATLACSPNVGGAGGGGGGGGCKPKGAPGTSCQTDADCSLMLMTSCCTQPTLGNLCLPAALCSMYQTMGCNPSNQAGCTGADSCCDLGSLGFGLCEPTGGCNSSCGPSSPCPNLGVCCTLAGASVASCLPAGTPCPSQCSSNSDCGGGENCCALPSTSYSECLPASCPPVCSATMPCSSGMCCMPVASAIYGTCAPSCG